MHLIAFIICAHREIYESGVTNIHRIVQILEVCTCFAYISVLIECLRYYTIFTFFSENLSNFGYILNMSDEMIEALQI